MSIHCLVRPLSIVLITLTAAVFAEEAAWNAGTARVKITPEQPLWMAGYGSRTHPSEGTLHDLWVKAVALETSDGGRAVVVTSDLLGIPPAVNAKICNDLQTRCGLERSRIMLTCSHTHCSPALDGALFDCYPLDDAQRAAIVHYTRGLEKKVAAVVVEALADLRPATLWTGQGQCDVAVNRRKNGKLDVAAMRAKGITPEGPTDHDVPVLAVRSPQGQLRAAVVGYACHNTTLDFYQWCGDYAGFTQLALEQKYPGAMALFWIGCGADQNPLPRRTLELCQQHGQSLAAATQRVLDAPMQSVAPRLRTAFATIRLAFQEQPTRESLQKILAVKGSSAYLKRWAQRLLGELDLGRSFAKDASYPIQVWKLGNQLWIALAGEVVVDYSLRFKKKYGPTTLVTGYANEVIAYIPSHRVWEEGGYEAGAFSVYGVPAERWTEDIETQIDACVTRLVDEVSRPSRGS